MKKSSITAQGTLQSIHVSYYKHHNYTARLQWSQNVRLIRFKDSRIPCQIKTTRMGVTMPLTMLRRQRSSFVYEHNSKIFISQYQILHSRFLFFLNSVYSLYTSVLP